MTKRTGKFLKVFPLRSSEVMGTLGRESFFMKRVVKCRGNFRSARKTELNMGLLEVALDAAAGFGDWPGNLTLGNAGNVLEDC